MFKLNSESLKREEQSQCVLKVYVADSEKQNEMVRFYSRSQ